MVFIAVCKNADLPNLWSLFDTWQVHKHLANRLCNLHVHYDGEAYCMTDR